MKFKLSALSALLISLAGCAGTTTGGDVNDPNVKCVLVPRAGTLLMNRRCSASEPQEETAPMEATGAPLAMKGQRVEKGYQNLENFDEMQRSPSRDTRWTEHLSAYHMSRRESALDDGGSLPVVMTNMSIAGKYRPGLGGGLSEMRVVAPNTPSRMDLTFRLLSSDANRSAACRFPKSRSASFATA